MPNKRRMVLSLVANLGLLLTSSAMVLSGFVIQLNYHMGHHGDIDKTSPVFGMTYMGWSDIHLVSIVIVSFLAGVHTIMHWKWYKAIVRKKLFARNKLLITLTFVFIAVAATGYIPLCIRLSGGPETIRKFFIEIHDKIALPLFIYLIIHVAKTLRWYFGSFKKLLKYRMETL
jgi:hypothetical protein